MITIKIRILENGVALAIGGGGGIFGGNGAPVAQMDRAAVS